MARNNLTAVELRDILNDVIEAYGDVPIKVAYQPNYPMMISLESEPVWDKETKTLYLTQNGEGNNYLPDSAFTAWNEVQNGY